MVATTLGESGKPKNRYERLKQLGLRINMHGKTNIWRVQEAVTKPYCLLLTSESICKYSSEFGPKLIKECSQEAQIGISDGPLCKIHMQRFVLMDLDGCTISG